MSNNSNPEKFLILIRGILEAAGWTAAIPIPTTWGIVIDTKKTIPYKDKGKEIGIRLLLYLAGDNGRLFLANFLLVPETRPDSPESLFVLKEVLQPVLFLSHYGKRLADPKDRGPAGELWEIKTGRNFEALLDAYDALAVRIGAMPLFHPTGKTN